MELVESKARLLTPRRCPGELDRGRTVEEGHEWQCNVWGFLAGLTIADALAGLPARHEDR